ncbi:4311_t:CDS:2 [Acaulospora morrowiae]|uniref:Molybdopterin synthase sulfur carrier subunit n=1 Tax=Acaulospora morrowiae TaxID=94023 RepID=A0A9N9AYW3_9GLOM|nr:4311_t:CDS:2 [Acaulospora morrowiae]
MSQTVILPDRAQPLANYPHARKVGGFIFVSGVSSRRSDNSYEGVKELPTGAFELDIREQTRAVIENIDTILKASGASLENVVDLTVFLIDMKDYSGFNEVYNKYFDAKTGPARTTVAVKELPSPKLLIEIKATAWANKLISLSFNIPFVMSKEFKVLYFASARDATNASSETIPFPTTNLSLSLQDLTTLLKARHEKLGPILDNSMYAINMQYVEKNDTSITVKPDDEVAIIPPVSGG